MSDDPGAPSKETTKQKIVDPIGRTRAGARALNSEEEGFAEIPIRRLNFTEPPDSALNTPAFEQNFRETVDLLNTPFTPSNESTNENQLNFKTPERFASNKREGSISPNSFSKQVDSETPARTTARRFFKENPVGLSPPNRAASGNQDLSPLPSDALENFFINNSLSQLNSRNPDPAPSTSNAASGISNKKKSLRKQLLTTFARKTHRADSEPNLQNSDNNPQLGSLPNIQSQEKTPFSKSFDKVLELSKKLFPKSPRKSPSDPTLAKQTISGEVKQAAVQDQRVFQFGNQIQYDADEQLKELALESSTEQQNRIAQNERELFRRTVESFAVYPEQNAAVNQRHLKVPTTNQENVNLGDFNNKPRSIDNSNQNLNTEPEVPIDLQSDEDEYEYDDELDREPVDKNGNLRPDLVEKVRENLNQIEQGRRPILRSQLAEAIRQTIETLQKNARVPVTVQPLQQPEKTFSSYNSLPTVNQNLGGSAPNAAPQQHISQANFPVYNLFPESTGQNEVNTASGNPVAPQQNNVQLNPPSNELFAESAPETERQRQEHTESRDRAVPPVQQPIGSSRYQSNDIFSINSSSEDINIPEYQHNFLTEMERRLLIEKWAKILREAVTAIPKPSTERSSFLRFMVQADAIYNRFRVELQSVQELEEQFIAMLMTKFDGTIADTVAMSSPASYADFKRSMITAGNWVRHHALIENEARTTKQLPGENALGFIARIQVLKKEFITALNMNTEMTQATKLALVDNFETAVVQHAIRSMRDRFLRHMFSRDRSITTIQQLRRGIEEEMEKNTDDTEDLLRETDSPKPVSFRTYADSQVQQDEPLSLASMSEILRTISSASKALKENTPNSIDDSCQPVLFANNVTGTLPKPVQTPLYSEILAGAHTLPQGNAQLLQNPQILQVPLPQYQAQQQVYANNQQQMQMQQMPMQMQQQQYDNGFNNSYQNNNFNRGSFGSRSYRGNNRPFNRNSFRNNSYRGNRNGFGNNNNRNNNGYNNNNNKNNNGYNNNNNNGYKNNYNNNNNGNYNNNYNENSNYGHNSGRNNNGNDNFQRNTGNQGFAQDAPQPSTSGSFTQQNTGGNENSIPQYAPMPLKN